MTANTETLHHIYAGDIAAAKVTDTPRGGNNGTGYGPKIPTPYMVQSFGPRPVWRRVYVVNYGNAGSAYVTIGGVNHYLSPGAELIVKTVRDGGTIEDARAAMTEWPGWMKDSEHLTAYTSTVVMEDGTVTRREFTGPRLTLDALEAATAPVAPAPAPKYVIAVFEPYMPGQGPRANHSELVTDWSGVAAHLERAGVDVPAAENILKAGGTYRYRDTAGKWCRVMPYTPTTEDGN